jgi:two-component system, chemotaxis family, sensor histidine kinase and response regulator PixL
MDIDKQIPLKFLDEAEQCCDQIEYIVLGLASKPPSPQELDQALRAAHSIKGGAAMMGFIPLSQVAHRLEDFFKILRLRYQAKAINTEVETLLLQGVDRLRQVSDLHRQGRNVEESWLTAEVQPMFDQLQSYLGELQPEDEYLLLAEEGDIDPALLLFEMGVTEALDLLESQIADLSPVQLLAAVQTTSDELSDFGRMAQLDRFIALCQSIEDCSRAIGIAEISSFTDRAIKLWRTSHSLVLLGRRDKIPTEIPSSSEDFAVDPDLLELVGADSRQENRFNPQLSGLDELTDFQSLDLEQLQAEFADFELVPAGEFMTVFDGMPPSSDLLNELAIADFPELSSEFITNFADDERQPDISNFFFDSAVPLELMGELAALELPEIAEITPQSLPKLPDSSVVTPAAVSNQTVRVPVEYLQQFNRFFGQLILERNAINLRLDEIRGYTGLLRKRMGSLESSNQALRQWYDRASTEGLISTATESSELAPIATVSTEAGFDALEFDHYSDLHLVSQDQIETIVQLQEVATDIEFSLRDMTQSVRGLNQTTRSLQKNLTRTQMVPFGEVVKPFPRLIRDLSVQFDKPVDLQIIGEHTGIDRAILDHLSDPLMHLLRNGFDHGIEDAATRLAAGKPAKGTILLNASQRGSETVITISDDGGGIQLERIRDRLQQMGLPATEIAKISEAELLDAIFEPGFSTATHVTELSGRGVGMDVVRTNLEEIRGSIQVETQLGIGTTFTLRVPFALSILRVMLLERAGLMFAVAVDRVREIVRFQPDLLTADETQMNWQLRSIPVVALEKTLNFNRPHRPFEFSGLPKIAEPTVLVVGEDRVATAFYIDRFWGEQEVTLRTIDSPSPLPAGFGNAIVLGDGRVLPLIDLISLTSAITTDAGSAGESGEKASTNQIAANRILVIDDSINVRRYLAVMLEKAGYQVEEAKDGQDAVEKLLGGLVVQAAICDVEMPRLDGYGVLEALRSNRKFETLPIVMLTSRNGAKHRSLAMNLGASAYFSKPYNEPELLEAIGVLIANP